MKTLRLWFRLPLTLLEILGELRAMNTRLERLDECIASRDGTRAPAIRVDQNRHSY